ncbi:MAG: hypothetical protein ACR2OI_10840 [Acidimicrobiia bacterium]
MAPGGDAAAAATNETGLWAELAREWTRDRHPALWDDLPASEAAVVRFYQPDQDLERRARHWGYQFADGDLADLCRLGAALALAEADGWRRDEPHIATRAYEDRRFLLGDRLLHWAVPWMDAAARCHPAEHPVAEPARLTLLELGDRLRPAPALTAGTEGLFAPGEDSYGPLEPRADTADFLLSVWSGRVLMKATIDSMGGFDSGHRSIPADWLADPEMRTLLRYVYLVAAPRWERMAGEHPGSARLWRDLAARARHTAGTLSSIDPD